MKRINTPLLTSIYFTLAPLFVSSGFIYFIVQHETEFSHFGVWEWLGITVFFTVTSMLALTPPTLLALVYGFFLGWWALPFLFFLNMGAILLVNILTNKLVGDRFMKEVSKNPKVETLLTNIKKEELKIIFWAKLSPVLPFALTNYILSVSKAQLKNILLGGFLGMIPRTVVAVWAGHEAKEIKTLLENPNQGASQQYVIIGLIILSVAGIFWVIRKAMR